MEFCLSRIFAGLLVESWKPQHIILMRYGFQGYWKWKMEWSQLFMYAQEVASALLQGSNGIQVKLPSFLKPFSKSSNMMNGIENDHWVAIQYIFVKRREKGTAAARWCWAAGKTCYFSDPCWSITSSNYSTVEISPTFAPCQMDGSQDNSGELRRPHQLCTTSAALLC